MKTLQKHIFNIGAIALTLLVPSLGRAQNYGHFRYPTAPGPIVIVEEAPIVVEMPTDEFRYTLYTGLNLSKLTFKKEKGEIDPDANIRPAFDLGLRIDHYIYTKFSYYRSMGLRYSYGSYKVSTPFGSVRTTQNRFIVPFTIGVLGHVGGAQIGVGPNIHLGAAIGGTNHLKPLLGKNDEYSASTDESSFVGGIGIEGWMAYHHIFCGISYNRSMEWYRMPAELGDYKSNGRHMVSFNIGLHF